MPDKKSFKLYSDLKEVTDAMTDKSVAQLFRAILAYENGEKPELTGMARVAFTPIKQQLDRNREAYEKQCTAGRESGHLGGRPKTDNPKGFNKNPKGYQENPKGLKKTLRIDTDTDTETDTDRLPPVSPVGETSPKGERKRKPKPPPADDGKTAYGENGNIRLTGEEHQKLVDEFGQADADRFIREADGWVQAKGKQREYKDWRQMVANWGRRERRNEPQAAGSGPGHGYKPNGGDLPPGYRDTSTKDYTEGL